MKTISTDRLLTLGLALYADRRTMENRVRGIFGRKRTAWFARVLAAALCLVVGVACFTTACVPVREAASGASRLQDWPLSVTVALPDRTRITAQYIRSDLPRTVAGAPVRDEVETVTPWEATDSAARMLLTVFGEDPLTVPLVVWYEDDDVTGARYVVRTRYTTQGEVQDYEASLDAATGKVYRASIVTKDYEAMHMTQERFATLDAEAVGAACLETAKALVRARFVSSEMVDEVESAWLSLGPYAFKTYDLICHTAVHTSGGESYGIRVLCDIDGGAPSLVQSVETIYPGAWNGYIADDPLPDDTPLYPQPLFSHAEVRKVFAALCGDAETYAWAETKDELARYQKNAKQMLALAKRHPHAAYYDGGLDEVLDDVSNAMKTAPAEREYMPLNLILTCNDGLLTLDGGKGAHASFQQFLYPRDMLRFSNRGVSAVRNAPVETPLALTREAAMRQADALFAEMGAEGFSLWHMEEELVNHTPFEACVDDAFKTHAWRMLYVLPGRGGALPAGIPAEDVYRTWESIELLLDDTGVLDFQWSRPGRLDNGKLPEALDNA